MRARPLSALSLAVCAAVSLVAATATPDGRPATFEDVMALKAPGSATISPDGRHVLYTVREWVDARRAGRPDPSGRRKEARTQVWRVATTGEPRPQQLTFGERGASSPGWSPDGRFISFVAARGEGAGDEGPRPQIWIMPADGGEGWAVTDAPEGVGAYAWSPDSRRLAYVSQDVRSADDEAKRQRRDDAAVFEGDFRFSHLWIVGVETRDATRVTEGRDFTVRGTPAWSPDGARIAFAAAPTPMTRDERSDIYLARPGSPGGTKITTNPGADSSPAWSPDGGTIAFLADPHDAEPKGDGIALQYVGNTHLMLYDLRSGRARDVSSPEFDLSAGAPEWSADGRRIYLNVGRGVYREMFAFDVGSGRYTRLTTRQLIASPSFSRDGARAAFIRESPSESPDVFVSGAAFASPRRLTTVNPQVADLALGQSEAITWSNDGGEVEGVLLKPVGFEPGRRYPLLVVVHGGPTGAHTAGARLADAGQVWAGAGWAVLYPNPRGSTNYGEAFMRANIPDWGGGDYRDIMTGVDAVIDRGIADPGKLAVMGWSYGGYMTCWIVSQTSRFKAAVMGAGLSNLVSMYGTTDIPDYLGTFFEDMPSDASLPLYRERSGLTWVDRVTTPLLILHGERDERVPIGQPMEFYRALKDRGKSVELVFYPREGHGLREYYHQLDRQRRQFEWINAYTLGDQAKKISQ